MPLCFQRRNYLPVPQFRDPGDEVTGELELHTLTTVRLDDCSPVGAPLMGEDVHGLSPLGRAVTSLAILRFMRLNC